MDNDQAIEGVLENGCSFLLAEWRSCSNQFDAIGWLEKFGDRVGSGTAKLPDGSWVDLRRFCLLRPIELTADSQKGITTK